MILKASVGNSCWKLFFAYVRPMIGRPTCQSTCLHKSCTELGRPMLKKAGMSRDWLKGKGWTFSIGDFKNVAYSGRFLQIAYPSFNVKR